MADIQSNIRVNIDTSEALANIKALQREISAFHVAMGKGGAAAAAQSAAMRQSLINGINSSGKFSASFQTISSSAENFTRSLEKNKLSMGEYFRYAGGASKSFGKYFKTEMNTIQKVAVERVKTLQTQYIKMGRDASGALKAIAVRPLALDMKNLGTQTALAAQKQQLLNQLLKQGSTNLLNFGKNTQWAGRQLMVGFTIPLATLGMAATKTFKQMEEQAIKFKRVYGDTFTATEETDAMLKQVQNLANEFTRYGVAIKDTMEMAATAAATGKQGADLLAQVADATRLSVLGNVEQSKALETTISLTNAFGTATKDLRGEINFLNAVENQTVTSIEDLTTAIPKAAPVIQQLGGDVKDLAFFLTAMREGGINASEGANALKSGLASLINPTSKATKMLSGFGIDLNAMVERNSGDVSKMVVDFAKALDTLDPLTRSRAIEQMFGKFQFARLSTLFQNVVKEGSQASRVLELMGQSSAELGILAQKELKRIESSPLYKFQKAIEDFKKELAPVGEEFMKAITPLINFGTDLLKSFNKLEPGIKQFIVNTTGLVAGLGPILLMTFGLIANGVANLIKGFALVKGVFNKATSSSAILGETTHYMTEEQLRAAAVAASLEQSHTKLAQAFTVERTALDALTASYRKSVSAQQAFGAVPGSPAKKTPRKKYAAGTYSVPGPKGAGDIVPAMLSPGEAVIPVKAAQRNRALIMDIINGDVPGYSRGSAKIPTSSQSAVVAFGAHQPFTVAHEQIARMGQGLAAEGGSVFRQFSTMQGKSKRSLLSDALKKKLIRESIGVTPELTKNPFTLFESLAAQGVKDVTLLLGQDRMGAKVFDLAAKEFGVKLRKVGIPRDPNSPSGTATRLAISNNDTAAYERLIASGASQATKEAVFREMKAAMKLAGGTFSVPGRSGTKIPAMLSPGETVIPSKQAGKYRGLISNIINGNIKGYKNGTVGMGMSSGGYVSEAQKAFKAAQQAKIEEVRKKNLAANEKKNIGGRPQALFVNQSLIEKLGLTGDSPISKAIAASAFTKKLFIGNTTGTWSEFRSSPAFNVLREAGLRENRYQTVPSTSFRELMKTHRMSTYNASGALVQYFNAGTENVMDPKTGKPKKVKKERRARNTKSVQGILNMLRSHTGSKPRSWASRLPKFEWEGMDQEISAGLMAAEEHMRSQGLPESKISRNLNNLRTVQLSHLKPESQMFDVAGRKRNLKLWRTKNVIPDSGIYNQYLKEIGDKKGFFDNLDPKQIASTSGMSESSVRKSIGKFRAGEHPATPGEYAALAAIGKQDTGSYAGAAASAAFKASDGRKGFFKSKAAGSFKLDPSLDALAEKDLNNLVKRATTNIEKLEGTSQFVADAEVKNNKKKEAANKKNTKAVDKNTAEVKKTTKITRKVYTMEERLAAATEKVTKAREAIADPNNRKRKFNQSEIKANNLLLYANPDGPTGDQRQARRDQAAAQKAERVALAQQRQAAKPSSGRPGRFGGLSAKIMGASMAASMAGGMIGGDAGNMLSQVGTAAFAASSIKELFSGAGGMKTRIMDSKSNNIVVKGLQKVLPKIASGFAFLAPKLLKFIPYVGLAALAFEVGVETWKALNAEQIKQAEVSKAITETLNTTKDKIDSLNSYFGTDAKLSGAKVAGVADMGKSSGKVNLAKDFQQSEEFASTYKETAAKLKGATKDQLTRTFQALGTELVGSGMSVDAAAIIIDAIQLEVGRSDIEIDPKTFTVNTKDAKEAFAKSSKQILDEFSAARDAYTSKYQGSIMQTYATSEIINGTDFAQEFNMMFDLTHQKVVELASTFASFWNGLGGQFQNGLIDAKDFNSQIDELKTQIAAMPKAQSLDLMNATFKKLNPDLYEFTKNIGSATDQANVLAVALRGIQIPPQILLALSGGTSQQKKDANKWLEDTTAGYDKWNTKLYALKKQLAGIDKQQEKLVKTEEEVNKKYDKRLAILDEIRSANEAISRQQKGQLDMADALTQGDVAGAAKAMQQMRADNAAYALDQQGLSLEQARQNELAPIQNQQTTINNNGDTIQTKIDKQINNGYKPGDLPGSVDNIPVPKKEEFSWGKFIGDRGFAGFVSALPFGGIINVLLQRLGITGSRIPDIIEAGGNPKANGGYISGKGTGTSDDIPAMLSNGEYVIRAKAAKALGIDTLDKMNHAEKFAKGGPINVAKYAGGGLVGRYADGGGVSLPDWMKWIPGLNMLTTGKAVADAVNTKTVSKKDPERDARHKKGGFEGFLAGFEGMMGDMGTNPAVKAVGAAISSNPYTDFIASSLGLPVNMIGTAVNNSMKNLSSSLGRAGDVFSGKKSYMQATSEAIGSLPGLLGNTVADPFVSTFGHMVDPNTDFKSGFTQAGQTVIDNKWFGTDTAEGAARARVFAGGFDLLADPLNYIGAGAAAKAAGIGSKVSKVTSKAGEAIKKPFKKTAPATEEFDWDTFDWNNPSSMGDVPDLLKPSLLDKMRYTLKPKMLKAVKSAPGNILNFGKSTFEKSRNLLSTISDMPLMTDLVSLISKKPKANMRLESLLKNQNLFHGSKRATSDFVAEILDYSAHNWFGASFFTTASKNLAKTYGNTFSVKGSRDVAKDMKILDLTPGAPAMDKQFPGIVDFISQNLFDANIPEAERFTKFIKPADVLEHLGSSTRHLSIASYPNFREVAERFGIDALRHLSGQGVGVSQVSKDMIDDVFAFFNPRGVEAIADQVKRANGGIVGRYNMGGMVKPQYFAKGGMVGHYAKGGDVVPSMLTPGEFVVNQPAVKKFGAGNLQSINNGSYGGGSKNVNVSNNGTNSANSVYNSYSVNINVSGESANPEALAKVVLKEIKKVSSQGIRGV